MDKPTITPLPTPPNRQQGAAEFAMRADEFLSALPVFGGQAQAAVDYIEYSIDAAGQVASDVQAAVGQAQSYAQTAQASAANAETSYQAAMAVAAAYGNEVGLPSTVGKAGHVLTVSQDEAGAVWSDTPIGTNAQGNKTISTEGPSGGAHGDIWYQVDL